MWKKFRDFFMKHFAIMLLVTVVIAPTLLVWAAKAFSGARKKLTASTSPSNA